MQNCPRSCPSRHISESELRNIDSKEDHLPEEIVKDITIWKKSIQKPLKMREYDVASYDLENSRFQEYQKVCFDFKYQLQHGSQLVR